MRSDEMAEINPDALLPDGLDDAYIGHTIGPAGRSVAVYDAEACIRVMARDSGMSLEEAEEYLDHNTFCAYVGPNSPLYARLTRQSGYGNLDARPRTPTHPPRTKTTCRRRPTTP